MIQTGTILQVKEYNKIQQNKWSKDCREYDHEKGGMPQLAFYVFLTNRGNFRKTGYVLKTKNGARLFASKADAEKKLNSDF